MQQHALVAAFSGEALRWRTAQRHEGTGDHEHRAQVSTEATVL